MYESGRNGTTKQDGSSGQEDEISIKELETFLRETKVDLRISGKFIWIYNGNWNVSVTPFDKGLSYAVRQAKENIK